jgi:hypothetical protein
LGTLSFRIERALWFYFAERRSSPAEKANWICAKERLFTACAKEKCHGFSGLSKNACYTTLSILLLHLRQMTIPSKESSFKALHWLQ